MRSKQLYIKVSLPLKSKAATFKWISTLECLILFRGHDPSRFWTWSPRSSHDTIQLLGYPHDYKNSINLHLYNQQQKVILSNERAVVKTATCGLNSNNDMLTN